MRDYALRRIALMIPSLLGVSLIIFTIMQMVPGDVVLVRLSQAGSFRPEDLERLRAELGLDRPVVERYFTWLGGAVRGDLGKSLWTGTPVSEEIMRRLPVTLEMGLLAVVTSTLFGVFIGVLSAVRQNSFVDYAGRMISVAGLSIPDFWLGTLLLVLPVVWFQYLPPMTYVPFWDNPIENLKQFLPPALALGARLAASVMRMTRSALLEVMRQDYIRTAWAKGLKERNVVYGHALKNAMIPVVTILGTQLSRLLGGTVVEESIFGLPGVGRLMLESITNRDLTQLQGNVLFLASAFLVINLIVDMSYAWLDPRIKY